MKSSLEKKAVFEQLRKVILSAEGTNILSASESPDVGLGLIASNFPGGVFPAHALHEFISPTIEHEAATTGFMAGLLSSLMVQNTNCLWIGSRRTLFAPALKYYGIAPEQVFFIDIERGKDLLWVLEEGLKCKAISAVVGEIKELTLNESRRLQLAIEKSRVPCFLHRQAPRRIENIACAARWKISPIHSQQEGGLPGVGFPRWQVELLKVRNGMAGIWDMEWSENAFHMIDRHINTIASSDKAIVA